ncbi:hypothetical protein KFL_010160020 [Klebsormidium nitens]|uniref:Uncharacterized protein n=1 Tax=Klebsormidium nitens TaxID=105231 RepID=A0A1Y1IT18_KLENI|nr:hypothetical protein KFL_010160020 [Klebsormidium nitens]|eukprot:GAQ92451.1 hypothetical protein KFL_010160020 [Klebsormidium nitens]
MQQAKETSIELLSKYSLPCRRPGESRSSCGACGKQNPLGVWTDILAFITRVGDLGFLDKTLSSTNAPSGPQQDRRLGPGRTRTCAGRWRRRTGSFLETLS